MTEMSSEWATRLKVGKSFDDFDELKAIIVNAGIVTKRIIYSYKKDRTTSISKCKMNHYSVESEKRYKWMVRAIKKKETGIVTITKAMTKHTCEAADAWKRQMHTHSDRLASRIIDIFIGNKQTRSCTLQDTAEAFVHLDIRYYLAWYAKRRALEKLDGNEKESFQLIPSHCHYKKS